MTTSDDREEDEEIRRATDIGQEHGRFRVVELPRGFEPRSSSSETLPPAPGPNLLAATSSNQSQPIPLDNEAESSGLKRGHGFFMIVGSTAADRGKISPAPSVCCGRTSCVRCSGAGAGDQSHRGFSVSCSKILEELGTKPAASGITVSASTSAVFFTSNLR
ncbi:hypothetical protein HDU96_008287 [Phlyctochytrium bullatum]|nr:hypothetical protein HDU96_008287 [Phlyctochytrium bullatum]